MDTMITFAGVTMATLVALFAALAFEIVLLKAMFRLMRPLSISRRKAGGVVLQPVPVATEQGTRMLARAYAKAR